MSPSKSQIAFSHPYVIALLKSRVLHIHHFETHKLVQILDVPPGLDAAYLESISYGLDLNLGSTYKGSIQVLLVSPSRGVYGLSLADTGFQVRALMSSGRVLEAIRMAEDEARGDESPSMVTLLVSIHLCKLS